MSITARTRFLHNLTAAFLSGDWVVAAITAAAARAIGKRLRWVTFLAKRAITEFPERPDFEALLTFIDQDAGVNRACRVMEWEGYPVRTIFLNPSRGRAPPAALAALPIPKLASTGAVAEWLGLSPGRLDWLADPTGRNRLHPDKLRTYRYRWVARPGGRARLLEIPRPLLRQAQRKLLDELLSRVPAHDAAHGFRPGRSAITNALAHCGRLVVVRFDLTDFFPSVPIGRVFALFATLGYPRPVARLLASLCTTRIPSAIWKARPNPRHDGSDHAAWQKLGSRHLPQGAPTSPAVANLIAFRLDSRLAKLAARLDATYTRYADDLTFSGGSELARSAKRLVHRVAVIAGEDGFTLNHRKTRVMRTGGRQIVTGVVVNVRPNLPRADFDRLKAILTNCVRHGPANQNRASHPDFRAQLAGRIAHLAAANPTRGRKLWELFDKIAWVKLPH